MFINSMEQSHPEKLIVAQLANKFHDFYKTWMFYERLPLGSNLRSSNPVHNFTVYFLKFILISFHLLLGLPSSPSHLSIDM
jgi:hypothetical protein